MPDGKIVFCTKIDNSQVDKDLKQLEGKIQQSEESISKNESAKLPLVKQANELGAKLDAAKASAQMLREEMEAINNAMAPGSAPDDYAAASANLPQVEAALKAQEKEVVTLQKQWDSVNDKIETCNMNIQQSTVDIERNKAKTAELAAQMESSGAKMSGAFASAKAAAGRFEQRIISLGKRILVFSVIATAFRGIKSYMDKALKTNEEYTKQLAQLKAALATAFQPIYEFILPGLLAVLKVLTSIVSVVANVLSALGGKTLAQSSQNAKALNREADALNDVGDAAKDAGKSLANFDEINTLSTEGSGSGGSGSGAAASQYDFGEFDTAQYKAKIDELTVYLSGALLAIGAILTFSGANVPLGIALMAAGAIGMAAVVKENWGKMSDELKGAIATVSFLLGGSLLAIGAVLAFSGISHAKGIALMAVGVASMAGAAALNWDSIVNSLRGPIGRVVALVSGALLVLGAILAFSGVKPALGITLMAVGAVGLVTTAALNWNSIVTALKGPVGTVVAIVSGALLALGAILAFSGVSLPLGIALMAAGAVGLIATATVNWNSIVTALRGPVGGVVAIISGALLALGAILAFSGANIPLGIALMAAGAASLATVAYLNWNTIKNTLQGPLGAVMALLCTVLLVVGAVLAFSGANIGLGIALIALGAAGLATTAAVNWSSITTALQGPLGNIMAIACGALLVLGLILAFTGVNIPLGIALIAAGAAGLVTVTAINWNAVRDKLSESWQAIKVWYNQNVAPKLTLRYWKDQFVNICEGLKQKIKDGINGAITLFNTFISWVNSKMKFSWDTKYILGKKIVDAGSMQLFTIPYIPYLAQGAVLPANKPFMAVVGDQKNGTNVEAPLETIKQALAEVMATNGGSGGDTIIRFEGDLAQLGRVLKPVIDNENNRVGRSLAKGVT